MVGVLCCAQQQALIIDGKEIARQIRVEIAQEVAALKVAHGRAPGLAVIQVGSRRDSQTYVRNKISACERAGIASFSVELQETAKEDDIDREISRFNADPLVDGILVQLPLPKHIAERGIIESILPEKDVDGIHPMNIGRLMLKGSEALLVPCTPKGIIELLLRSGITIEGKRAAVIGRSNIVGMPVAKLLEKRDATVTVIHSQTVDRAEECRRADIVIAAAGKANLVDRTWVKPGAVVIDVGINNVEDPSLKRGYRLVGDVCFDDVRLVASAITPVPGGVGPMTVAMLLQNTVEAAKLAFKKRDSKRERQLEEQFPDANH